MGPGALRGRAIARIAALAACAALSLASLAASQTLSEQPANGQAGKGQNGNGGRLVGGGAGSGTMDIALVQAYQNNPQLNSQRAATRAVDENVPTALAGYRPRVSGTASLTDQYLDNLTRGGIDPRTGGTTYIQLKGQNAVQSYGITA